MTGRYYHYWAMPYMVSCTLTMGLYPEKFVLTMLFFRIKPIQGVSNDGFNNKVVSWRTGYWRGKLFLYVQIKYIHQFMVQSQYAPWFFP